MVAVVEAMRPLLAAVGGICKQKYRYATVAGKCRGCDCRRRPAVGFGPAGMGPAAVGRGRNVLLLQHILSR